MKAMVRRQALAAAAAATRHISPTGPAEGKSVKGSGVHVHRSKAASAVRYALSQVGKSYVAARAGPRTFDCSGLTLAAWRQAGVSLIHYSKSQYAQTRRVPVSQIHPGDLVFYFGFGAHHVGMYVGNGKMVSASNPDDGVEFIDFLGPWYRERFSGVGRVV
jgi:cell wall-associated NlpC family hydrolase